MRVDSVGLQVLNKPWTLKAKGVRDELRGPMGPFRVYWLPNLPAGFDVPASTSHVEHIKIGDVKQLKPIYEKLVIPKDLPT
jgi:hypothetical protein